MAALLGILLVLVFAVHLVCVNIAGAGPVMSIYLDLRGRHRADPLVREIGYTTGRWAVWGVLLGGVLGAIAGGLMAAIGFPSYFAALGRIPDHRLHWLAAEWLVYLLLMIPFAFHWRWHERLPWLRYILGFAAAMNLLYHFPPMFAILSKISSEPEWVNATIDRRQFHQLMLDPSIVARSLHHWIAAAATVGLFTAWLALRSHTRGAEPSTVGPLIRIGAAVTLIATLLQIPSGIWFLLTYPVTTQGYFLGGDLLTTALFGMSVLLSVGLLHHAAMITLGDVRRTPLTIATVLLLATIICMSGALHRARQLNYERLESVQGIASERV